MEGDVPQIPVAQEVKPEAKGVTQVPEQSPAAPQTPPPLAGGSSPPEKPKKKSKAKIIIMLY